MSAEKYNNLSLARALENAGIKKENVSRQCEEPELFIKKEEIPLEMIEKIESTLKKLELKRIDLPFFHIFPYKLIQVDGEKSTNFIEEIQNNGLKINTNGATFIKKKQNHLSEISDSNYFLDKPEVFIENLVSIFKKYIHHGVRTNKKILGFSNKGGKDKDYVRMGIGIPAVAIMDVTNTPIKRGKDGEEHYVIQRPIRPDKIMGIEKLENFNPGNKKDLIVLINKILEIVNNYIDEIGIDKKAA